MTEKEVTINLNTHIIKVKLKSGKFITYPAYKKRPKIIYVKIPDKAASGAFKLTTDNVVGLPKPVINILYLVNRDTIAATRKIEARLRRDPELKGVFEFIDANQNWRETIKDKTTEVNVESLLTFVNRKDLRAPGEQVRIGTKVDHCLELISEWD